MWTTVRRKEGERHPISAWIDRERESGNGERLRLQIIHPSIGPFCSCIVVVAVVPFQCLDCYQKG